MPQAAWVAHPNGIRGNSALRLISVGGGATTTSTASCSRRRSCSAPRTCARCWRASAWSGAARTLMRLAPHAEVPEHADINYHWHYRVRVHIPVTTRPEVMFHCGGDAVHMQAGEAWIFDSWRQHHVTNGSDQNASTWWPILPATPATAAGRAGVGRRAAAAPLRSGARRRAAGHRARRSRRHRGGRGSSCWCSTCGRSSPRPAPRPRCSSASRVYHALLDAFCRDWRQAYALYGETAEVGALRGLRQRLREGSLALGDGLVTRTNQVAVHKVLEGRLLRAMLPAVADAGAPRAAQRGRPSPAAPPRPPVFIIAAPRSGSTLLFETLCASGQVSSFGGEGHWLVEDIARLRPGAGGVDSNRLTALQADADVAAHLRAMIGARSVDADGAAAAADRGLQFIEKTPKNALRIPFLQKVFPDARFIFLWRDPRENLASIIEAWRSGRWKTYNGLAGFDGPWSLLLPPGWQAMNGRPLEEIAAFQWDAANRTALDDLQQLPRPQWTPLRYADLVATPRAAIERLCAFLDLPVDARLAARVDAPLPNSRFTLTPPASDKWRANAAAIERVLPSVAITWRRLEALGGAGPAGA
ncbi:MAG: sulfotransferase [Steroidobacteraceae bacterium]